MSQPKGASRGPSRSRKLDTSNFPKLGAKALNRALSEHGDARMFAAEMEVHETTVHKWRSGDLRIPVDYLPRIAGALTNAFDDGGERASRFLNYITRVCGYSVAPVACASDETFDREVMQLHAALGAFDQRVLDATADDHLSGPERRDLADHLDAVIRHAQSFRSQLLATAPIKLHG